jgi:uncharacterized protein (TIGR03083 family)
MSIDYTTHLRADGELMAQAVARDLDAHVPSCPDWNVARLTIHTGMHHRWVADTVRGGGDPPPEPSKPGLRGDELIDWFRRGWADLADLLDEMDDATPAWSWSGDNRVGFWRRRTALETLVHRWDAENATGTGSPLDPLLAADGVDEMLFVMLPNGSPPYEGKSGSLSMKTTDAPGAWTLPLEGGKVPEAARSKRVEAASTAISATAEQLLLFVWGRRGPDAIQVEGDRKVFDDFLSWST